MITRLLSIINEKNQDADTPSGFFTLGSQGLASQGISDVNNASITSSLPTDPPLLESTKDETNTNQQAIQSRPNNHAMPQVNNTSNKINKTQTNNNQESYISNYDEHVEYQHQNFTPIENTSNDKHNNN